MSATKEPEYFEFGEETKGYNLEGNGNVGIATFSIAVQTWALRQEGKVTVAAAARAFVCNVRNIIEAVDWNMYMLLTNEGKGTADPEKTFIDHDGD